MKKRVVISRILLILMGLIVIAAIVAYFILQPDKPWLAFYVACCAGVCVVNLVICLIFVRKNVKQ
ncbi:MAG: hypothetical protein LBR49_07225 [Tannerella sp.]|jgi:zinc transporter ZupT|nr:hypothetical protein [Tannerella sp.]